MEADIRVIDVVDSTNICIEELAGAGAREGTCVVAFKQLHGQGRSGRSFYSPDGGNLYMSVLLRPHDAKQAERITVAAAVATTDAIRDKLGIDTGIKWVNDIILDGRKVSGMVAQAHNYGTDDFYVVLGIGINIYESPDIPKDIENVYGSLMGRKCDEGAEAARNFAIGLAREIIKDFSLYYDDFEGNGCAARYRQRSVVIGRDVSYICGNDTISARVVDIDDDGGIVLEEGGVRRTYRDGEIRIRLTGV